jgi:hypothetical protein
MNCAYRTAGRPRQNALRGRAGSVPLIGPTHEASGFQGAQACNGGRVPAHAHLVPRAILGVLVFAAAERGIFAAIVEHRLALRERFLAAASDRVPAPR